MTVTFDIDMMSNITTSILWFELIRTYISLLVILVCINFSFATIFISMYEVMSLTLFRLLPCMLRPWVFKRASKLYKQAIQVAAARVFSKLCVVASGVQPYRIGNVSVDIDAVQVNTFASLSWSDVLCCNEFHFWIVCSSFTILFLFFQINDLRKTIFGILVEKVGRNEDLLTSILDLLISAARYQVCDSIYYIIPSISKNFVDFLKNDW